MKPQMNTKAIRKTAIIAVMVGFSLVTAAKTGGPEQISIHMHQARVHASQAVANLELLQTYSIAGIPWQVHFNRLQHVEDNVNALVNDYNRLNSLRTSATPAQVEALDRVQPLLQDLATHVKDTLRYLDYNSSAVNMPPFTERIRAEYASVNSLFATLCECATKDNNLQVSSAKDPSVSKDCSNKSFVTMP